MIGREQKNKPVLNFVITTEHTRSYVHPAKDTLRV